MALSRRGTKANKLTRATSSRRSVRLAAAVTATTQTSLPRAEPRRRKRRKKSHDSDVSDADPTPPPDEEQNTEAPVLDVSTIPQLYADIPDDEIESFMDFEDYTGNEPDGGRESKANMLQQFKDGKIIDQSVTVDDLPQQNFVQQVLFWTRLSVARKLAEAGASPHEEGHETPPDAIEFQLLTTIKCGVPGCNASFSTKKADATKHATEHAERDRTDSSRPGRKKSQKPTTVPVEFKTEIECKWVVRIDGRSEPCGKIMQLGNLGRHWTSKHTGHLMMKCPVCPDFTEVMRSDSMKRHVAKCWSRTVAAISEDADSDDKFKSDCIQQQTWCFHRKTVSEAFYTACLRLLPYFHHPTAIAHLKWLAHITPELNDVLEAVQTAVKLQAKLGT